MSELEDKINGLLSNPGEMEKIASLAKSLMGGGSGASGEEAAQPDIDPGMLQKISGIMSRKSESSGNDKRLLEAMRPYLSEKRRGKVDKALKIAKLAGLAEIAMSEFGGDEDV
ncbi:MAG: hypothetical protein Q4C13_08405 [Clostridia bacterium]|nr:hypothetical protein [Clostridia bacterium]